VVLFDEIEKAHHDVFNVLLQILDEGRLTDGQGRTVDFKNTVLILTSNIGAQALQDAIAEKKTIDAETRAEVMDLLKQQFRPEFINRIDETVIFEPLKQSDIAQVVDLQMARLKDLAAAKRITLELTPKAREFLAHEGYDPIYGARPLKRAIQKHVQDPLALKLLAGEFVPGDHVTIDAAGNGLKLSVRPRA
jgi:ATP-dependent Clp protease ATP-binding subunit ClpB